MNSKRLELLGWLLLLLAFIIDVRTPPGYNAGLLYLVPVLLGMWATSASYPWWTASVGTCAKIAQSLLLDNPRTVAGTILENRISALLLLWLVAWIVSRHAQARTRLIAQASELGASARHLRAILDATLAAVIIIDEEHVIRTCNRGATQLLGYEAEEILGHHAAILVPDTAAAPAVDLESYLRTSPPMVGGGSRVEVVHEDGHQIPVEVSTQEFESNGDLLVCVFMRDISEQEKLERHLRHAQKMEAIGTLASGIAHDFNNLLMGIGGCASIALSDMDAQSRARPFLEEVKKSTLDGKMLTKQLLALSRDDKKRDDQAVELNEVVAGMEALLATLLGENIELALDLRARDSRVGLDPGKVEQVIMNLAINGRDAMRDGGMFRIETSEVTIEPSPAGAQQPGRYVELAVRDTGCGMSQATAERIFEPFFTTKGIDRGTGLGLFTLYGIVTKAGGYVDVQSSPDHGTCFTILLPLVQLVPASLPAPAVATMSARGSETILLVEDQPLVRLSTKHFLETGGYHVLEAKDGVEALQCCRHYPHPVDLLLTDVVLPSGDGPQIAQEIARLRPGIGILMMSAYDPEHLVEVGKIPVGTPALQKPFRENELLESVRQVLYSWRGRGKDR